MAFVPITGLQAFQTILKLTRPVNGSTELWLKLGHNKFVVGNYTPDGHFPIWETKLTDTEDSKSRVRTKQHPDCWEFVSNWAKDNNGGVFFVPTQPQGFPLKDAIAFSDDIAAELDEGTPEAQLDLISQFVTISGLEPTYIIHSGSKSYHPHWKATEHLPIEQTIYLRQLLCIALNSDPAIAEKLGVTQGWVSQFTNSFKGNWIGFRKILVSLLKDLDRSTNIWDCPEINAFIEGKPLEVVEHCIKVLKSNSWPGLESYLSAFSIQIQSKILGLLASIFLPETQKQFLEREIYLKNSS